MRTSLHRFAALLVISVVLIPGSFAMEMPPPRSSSPPPRGNTDLHFGTDHSTHGSSTMPSAPPGLWPPHSYSLLLFHLIRHPFLLVFFIRYNDGAAVPRFTMRDPAPPAAEGPSKVPSSDSHHHPHPSAILSRPPPKSHPFK